MLVRLIKAVSLASSAMFVLGCASISTPPTYGLDEQSAALVRQTCNDIMGLRVGPEYEACGDSLAETVRMIQQSNVTAQADTACGEQGLQPGTAELAKCVVTYRRASNIVPVSLSTPAANADAQPWMPYFSMSDAQKFERMELSCAQLGLHPSWGSFSYCVADLRHSILNIRDWTMN